MEDLKSAFCKKKDKTTGESSNSESFNKTHDKKAADYEPETPNLKKRVNPTQK